MTTTTYKVTGMTCEHCANAVTTEVTALADLVCSTEQMVEQVRALLGEREPGDKGAREQA